MKIGIRKYFIYSIKIALNMFILKYIQDYINCEGDCDNCNAFTICSETDMIDSMLRNSSVHTIIKKD